MGTTTPIITTGGAGYVPNGYSWEQAAKANSDKESGELPIWLENTKRFVHNIITSPIRGISDAALYLADVAGAPSNVTNPVRDVISIFPQ
ncbi:MAG: hypothetical protein IKN65_03200 [Clostridia bacterium]|nr:hypothetical protein [Clostridia bacterium]